MCTFYCILFAAVLHPSLLPAKQPPSEEKNSSERRSQEQAQNVPLDRLQVPENGIIVVTPDIKKALDALGAGSVVLSAERYQELMNKIEKNKSDKSSMEILFAKCQITGEVKQQAGREVADLTIELEFRTENPNAAVPIPLKGVRLSSATLNGQAPIWGPDPEKWTLIIKDPQKNKLTVTTTIPISRNGQEKRLSLERVPASAITSLDLIIPDRIPGATIIGYGNVGALPLAQSKSQLTAPALGVLSSLDLTWHAAESGFTPPQISMEGDIKIVLEESQATIEARLKPQPFSPIQLPWKLRLPGNAQQIRAELLRTESTGSEALVVTREKDDIYVLTTPYAMSMASFAQVAIRWKQALPEFDSSEPVVLGTCQLIEPAGMSQSGNLQIMLPEEPAVFLKPLRLQTLDRTFATSDREMRRSPRYRYLQQPAGLEATAFPRSASRGVIETRLQHTLSMQNASWILQTEIEILRSARSSLSQLELQWPSEWQVSRKLLFSPSVKEIEQDSKTESLRIYLDGRQPESFSLKLESVLASDQPLLNLKIPQLLAAKGQRQNRLSTIDIVVQQERFKIDSRGWNYQIMSGTNGVRDESGDNPNRAETSTFQITKHPAQLVLQRQPRMPKWNSRADIYVGKQLLQTRQTLQLRSAQTLPRRVTALIPKSIRSFQLARMNTDSPVTTPIQGILAPSDDSSAWNKVTIEIPKASENMFSLLFTSESDAAHPITVPLIRLDDVDAVFEGTATVLCYYEAGINLSLPAEFMDWKVTRRNENSIELHGISFLPLLVLDRQDNPDTIPKIKALSISSKVEPDGPSILMEQEIEMVDLQSTQVGITIGIPSSNVTLLGWKMDSQKMPLNLALQKELNHTTSLTFTLPPEKLFHRVKVAVGLRVKQQNTLFLNYLPSNRWNNIARMEMVPVYWQIKADPADWLWWSNANNDDFRNSRIGWLPIAPSQHENRLNSTYYSLISLASTETLNWISIPRGISMLILSGLALLMFPFLRSFQIAFHILLWPALAIFFLLLMLYPVMGIALFWSLLPALLICLFFYLFRYVRNFFTRKSTVFQTSMKSTVVTSRVPVLSGSSIDAPTILTSPPHGSR